MTDLDAIRRRAASTAAAQQLTPAMRVAEGDGEDGVRDRVALLDHIDAWVANHGNAVDERDALAARLEALQNGPALLTAEAVWSLALDIDEERYEQHRERPLVDCDMKEDGVVAQYGASVAREQHARLVARAEAVEEQPTPDEDNIIYRDTWSDGWRACQHAIVAALKGPRP